uniref:Putative secreted protein n=1 Tax=Anopheles darlingi TaxID=43151 RepID=A0A2M4DIS8_ANODA
MVQQISRWPRMATKIVLMLAAVSITSAEYYQKDYYSEYECSEPLLEHAALSATSQLRERGPENARLNGKHTSRNHRKNEQRVCPT